MQPLSKLVPAALFGSDKIAAPRPATSPAAPMDPEEAAERAKAVQRFIDARREFWAKICPADYLDTVVSRLAEPAQEALSVRLPQDAVGLMFAGKTGHGKTRTALEIARRMFCSRSISFKHITGRTLADNVLDAYKEGGIRFMREELENVYLLLLDDLFKGNWTPSVESLVFNLLEFRISRRKPTIITTNSDGDQINAILSPDMREPFLRRIGRDYFRPFPFMKKPKEA